jgi:hypothetical protein
MKIFAQADKLVHAGDAGQSQIFRALTKPMSRHMLAFSIIITNGQMLFEIVPGILQAELRFDGQHIKCGGSCSDDDQNQSCRAVWQKMTRHCVRGARDALVWPDVQLPFLPISYQHGKNDFSFNCGRMTQWSGK